MIGEEEYLNKGIGNIIIEKLEEKIIEIGGKEIFADPVPENKASQKVLLSNGFIQIKEDVFAKKLLLENAPKSRFRRLAFQS